MTSYPSQVTLLPPSPLTLGQVIMSTIEVLRRRFGLFIALSVLPIVLVVGVVIAAAVLIVAIAAGGGLLTDRFASSAQIPTVVGTSILVMLAAVLIAAAIQIKAAGMLVLLAFETALGRRPDFNQLNEGTRGIIGRALVLIILLGLSVSVVAVVIAAGIVIPLVITYGPGSSRGSTTAILFGVLLLIALAVASFVLGVRWLYYQQTLAIEGAFGFAVLGRSWGLTRGQFWRTFGWAFVGSFLLSLVGSVLSGIANTLTASVPSGQSASPLDIARLWLLLPVFLLMALYQVLALPAQTIYTTVMYMDQVARHNLRTAAPGPWTPPQYPQQQPGQYPQPPQQFPPQQPPQFPQPPGYGTPQ